MVMPIPPEVEVLERFARIVSESLRIEPEQVTPDANLSDLGAESLDLLEITMEVEEEFDVIVPQKSILETAEEVLGRGVLVADGRLTAQGVRFLRQRMPEAGAQLVAAGMTTAEIAPMFQRVGAWVRMIQGLMMQSPRACPTCGAALSKAVAGRMTCTVCAAQVDLPSGDDLNRGWVEEYQRTASAPVAGGDPAKSL